MHASLLTSRYLVQMNSEQSGGFVRNNDTPTWSLNSGGVYKMPVCLCWNCASYALGLASGIPPPPPGAGEDDPPAVQAMRAACAGEIKELLLLLLCRSLKLAYESSGVTAEVVASAFAGSQLPARPAVLRDPNNDHRRRSTKIMSMREPSLEYLLLLD